MKYERFEQLPVWQAAAGLAARMFPCAKQKSFRGMGDLTSQLQRATLSVSNNIAEGFERGTTAELLTFLYYARGSAGEVRSMLCVMVLMKEFEPIGDEIVSIKNEAESISRQLRAWAGSLQNSDVKGARHFNDRSKQRYENRMKRVEVEARSAEVMKAKERELMAAAKARAEKERKSESE